MREEKIRELKEYVDELRMIRAVKRNENERPFLKTESYLCYLNNGMVIPRERLIKGNDHGGAVIVMPVTKDGEVLVVIEPRVFIDETVGIGFPAGYIESDESIIEAARRELREETGYVSEDIVLIDKYYPDEGCSNAINYIFIAFGCEKKYPQKLDGNEIVKYMLFSYDELHELEESGFIKGVNSKLLLAKSKKYVRERIK